ncbi:glycoside hydrolase, putative, partial [Phytophthora infestans T30-4]
MADVASYDWAADEHEDVWKPHLEVMQDLGVNTIRLYSVDPSVSHDKFMCACSQAGIYVSVGMAAPCVGCSVADVAAPKCYPDDMFTRMQMVYNAFAVLQSTTPITSDQQVMSPTGSDGTSQQQNPRDVQETDVHGLNVAADPFELFEGTHSESGASDAPGRGSRNSSASSERLDKLEGLIEGMAKQQAKFMADQAELQKQLQHRTDTPSFEHKISRCVDEDADADDASSRDADATDGERDEYATADGRTMAEQFVPPPNLGLRETARKDVGGALSVLD